ncbi:MAG: hypothetical protein CML05_05235 [Pseudozobellia sp.]|nr:hypothetical protein [Pseudozobellia sp.]|tara:strand:- start:159339 stop:159818 length:480 start_codon:yes stop_codon:yes gene_type:complete
MAKLDEIAELLTEEIHGFEKSIAQLERLHGKMKDLPLRPDTTELDRLLRSYGNEHRETFRENRNTMGSLLERVERSVLLPVWALRMFGGLALCVLLVVGFSIHQLSQVADLERAAFKDGRESTVEHFEGFFRERPLVRKQYREWAEEKAQKQDSALSGF